MKNIKAITSKGGVRPGAGRKTKEDEQKIIDRLDNIINLDDALLSLKKQIELGNMHAITKYLEYRLGKPKERIEVEEMGDTKTYVTLDIG